MLILKFTRSFVCSHGIQASTTQRLLEEKIPHVIRKCGLYFVYYIFCVCGIAVVAAAEHMLFAVNFVFNFSVGFNK